MESFDWELTEIEEAFFRGMMETYCNCKCNCTLAQLLTENDWILKDDELPNAYEEAEILMIDGKNIHRDMIIRGKYGNLEWRNWEDKSIKAWRRLR